MTVNKYWMPAIVIVALLGTVGVFQLTGDWIISGKQTYGEGTLTPADLKGWMTLQQVSDGLAIPVGTIYELAGIDQEQNVPADTALKDIEGLVEGFEVSGLREAAELYLSGNAQIETSSGATDIIEIVTPEPQATAGAPAPQPTPTETPHAPLLAGSSGDGTGDGPTPLPEGQVLPPDEIRGRMTLQEVADQCDVPLTDLLAVLQLPATYDPTTELKTMVDQIPGFEVQLVKDAVTALRQ